MITSLPITALKEPDMNNPQRQAGGRLQPFPSALKELNIIDKVRALLPEHLAPSGLIISVVLHPQLALGVINI